MNACYLYTFYTRYVAIDSVVTFLDHHEHYAHDRDLAWTAVPFVLYILIYLSPLCLSVYCKRHRLYF